MKSMKRMKSTKNMQSMKHDAQGRTPPGAEEGPA